MVGQIISILGNVEREASPVRGNAPNRRATGDDAGAQIGQALQGFGNAIGNLGDTFAELQARAERERKQRKDFTEEASFIDFQAAQQAAFEEASRSVTGSNAIGFTQGRKAALESAWAEWKKANPSANPERREAQFRQFAARMGLQALQSEFRVADQFYSTQIKDKIDLFAKGILTDPNGAEGYISQGDALIDASGLPEGVKGQFKAAWRETAARAKADALLRTNPALLNQALRAAPAETEPTRETEPNRETPEKPFKGSYHPSMSSAAVSAMDTLQGRFGKLNIISQYRDPGHNARVGGAKGSQHVHGNAFDIDVRGMPIEKRQELIRQARAAGFRGIGVYANSLHFDVGADRAWGPNYSRSSLPAWAAEAVSAPAGQPAATAPGIAVPTDPVLANLSYADTLRYVDQAENAVAAQAKELETAQRQEYASRLNTLLVGINDGTLGAGAITAAREEGWLTDFSDIKRAQETYESRTKKDADFNQGVAALNDQNTVWNQFDSDQKKQMDAVAEKSPNPIETGFQIWSRTGIVPGPSVAALRGGLVSTDPQKVLAAATIAGNMIAANPNAFASVGGGREDLEAAGVEFNRQVNKLGRTPEEAAQAIARLNDPTVKATAPKREDVQEFEKTLRKDGVTNDVVNAFDQSWLTDPELGVNAEQKAAIESDYIAFATENFRTYGDPDRAKEYAANEMKKLYGVSNGRVTKFPPEKIYPAIGDAGHNYLYEQAAGLVAADTGKAIDPKNVYFVPVLRGATAEAWRQGKLPPYQVTYTYEDPETGQMIFDTAPKLFVGDVAAPANAERDRRETEMERLNAEARMRSWREQKQRFDMQQKMIGEGLWNVAPEDRVPDPGPMPALAPPPANPLTPPTAAPEGATLFDPLIGMGVP